MSRVLLPLSFVVGIGLVAGPAAAAPSVEIAPPSDIIAFDAAALSDNAHPPSPFSSVVQPVIPGPSGDGKGDPGGEESNADCPVIGTAEERFAEKINRARARRDRRPVSLDL